MGQHRVFSYLTVILCRRDVDGVGWSTYVTKLTVLPQLTGANAALWGDGSASSDVNGERLVPYALVGLDLTPVPGNPDAINAVALLELIFAEGIGTGVVFQPAAEASTYTVGSTLGPDGTTLDITVGGAHTAELRNTADVLVGADRRLGVPAAVRRAGRAHGPRLQHPGEQHGRPVRTRLDPALGLARGGTDRTAVVIGEAA